MTTFNTGNAVPSTNVKDLYDNAETEDEVVNSDLPTTTTRTGKVIKTFSGMNQDFYQLMLNSGYESVHLTYVDGTPLVVNRPTQLIDRAGSVYRVKLPATFPLTLTGTWATDQSKLLDVGDQALRSQLAANGGALLVNGAARYIVDTQALLAAAGRYDGDRVQTMAYAAARPQIGAGDYTWFAGSTATADNARVFQVTGVTNGRWILNIKDALYTSQAGCVSDYSGNTGTDNRLRLQAAVDAWPYVIVDGKYGTTFDTANIGAGIIIKNDDFKLEFAKSAKISALAHNNTIYQMIRVWERNNVKIVDARLDGRKDLNSASGGEFGMGIDIRGGSEIDVLGAKTLNCWGDGIYIGASAAGNTVNGLTVDRHVARYCRRQGMSLVSGVNVSVNDPIWTDIAGTAPAAGLDIEPDNNNDYLIGIRINNPRTARCVSGILIYLSSMTVGGTLGRDVDIAVTGHSDIGSKIAINFGGCKTTVNDDGTGASVKIKGRISVVNPTSINAGGCAISAVDWAADGPAIIITRPTAIDNNRDGQTSPNYGAPFACYRDFGSTKTYPIGNFMVENATVSLRSGSIPALYSFDSATQNNSAVKNCHFYDPVQLDGISGTMVRGVFGGLGSFRDAHGIWGYQIAGSTPLDINYGCPVLFSDVASNITIPAGYAQGGSPDLIIRTTGAATYSIILPAAGAIIGLSSVTQLRSVGGSGSYVRLRPVAVDKYLLVERVGLWTDI